MLTRIPHSFRSASIVLAFVMLVTAVAPASVWRCLDGTLCPMGGAMPHAAGPAKAKPAPAAHSCCQPKIVAAPPSGESVSSAMQCVLTHSDSPAATIVRAQLLPDSPDFDIALPQPALTEMNSLQPAEWVILSSDLPPPDCLSARFGRSPPAFVS